MTLIDPELRGWRRKCPRCRVGRCDRCVGALDCGCDSPEHAWNQTAPAPEKLIEVGQIGHPWGGPMGEGTHYYDDGCPEHSGDNVPEDFRITQREAAQRGEEVSRALPDHPEAGRVPEADPESAERTLDQLTLEGGAVPYPHRVQGFRYTGDDAEKVAISATVPMALKAAAILAAQLQQRAIGAVVQRALEHYLLCVRLTGACPHTNDEVP